MYYLFILGKIIALSFPRSISYKLAKLFDEVQTKDSSGKIISFDDAIDIILDKIEKLKKTNNKVMFIGNGGSAGIATHQAIDYWKNGKIPAINFNDPGLLTCISNDYGYEYVFEKPIKMFSKKDDILISISSSGKSENILNAAKAAKNIGVFVITMSGFSTSNPLRKLGDLNFYIPSNAYGHVEIAHLIISHIILDSHLKTKI